MFSFSNKKQKIVVVGSGYWGSIIINTLIELGFKNIIIHIEIINQLIKGFFLVGFSSDMGKKSILLLVTAFLFHRTSIILIFVILM